MCGPKQVPQTTFIATGYINDKLIE